MMDRINRTMPKYIKRMGIMVGVGMVFMFAHMYVGDYLGDGAAGANTGRALLSTYSGAQKCSVSRDLPCKCEGDMILPIFPGEETWSLPVRGVLYLIFLGYLFLGVGISADTFMAAIEVITAKTKTVVIGDEEFEVEVWNSTVANLTLMALGSSAPEILLAVVETCGLGFQAGDLGPGTIVGSAAFNLLFITAICISCLDESEDDPSKLQSRKIDEFGVYVITAVCSLWAYLWMVICLAVWTPDLVTITEGILTLVMFPILVVVCYGQDQNWWGYCGTDKVTPEGDEAAADDSHVMSVTGPDGKKRRRSSTSKTSGEKDAAPEEEEDPVEAAKQKARDDIANRKKSRLAYRIQATRKMTGGKRVINRTKETGEVVEEVVDTGPEPALKIGFAEVEESCIEHCGVHTIKVIRSGDMDKVVTFKYDTSDGNAKAGIDYVANEGSLTFEKGVSEVTIGLTINDDKEWAPDKCFYVRLLDCQCADTDDIRMTIKTTKIIILNDDFPGTISFEELSAIVESTAGSIDIPLSRKDGTDGNALAFFKTNDGTALAGVDFKPLDDEFEVHFKDTEAHGSLHIELINNPQKPTCTFTVELTSVQPEGAQLGERTMVTVIKSNDKNYTKLMQDVLTMMDEEMDTYSVGTSSWQEQFNDAMNIGAEDPDAEPEWSDYLMHFLSFYWKVIHAFIPPTDKGGGWYTFVVALCSTGVITVFVGDCAKMLGCVIGLDDGITAITFVALGTSLPDTFASMEATVSDDNADAAITNVTGSNSVNVFLGLGIPWTMATVYHIINGTEYNYAAGDLVYSVLVFFVFAFACIGLLFVRRIFFDGELGGNKIMAYLSTSFLVFAWLAYVVMSAMKTKGLL